MLCGSDHTASRTLRPEHVVNVDSMPSSFPATSAKR